MPLAQGYISEEQKEEIEKRLVQNGPFDDVGDALQYCVSYTLYNKFDVET